MAQNKLLHELLKEDQEPFLLTNYISDRRTALHLKKRKHTSSSFPLNLCKNASCIFSSSSPQHLTKSPLFSPPPPKTPNAFFLHIPNPKTAALLLQAALRIHKHTSKSTTTGFASFFKRLRTHRKKELEGAAARVSVKDILTNQRQNAGNRNTSEFPRSTSAVWSDSNKTSTTNSTSSNHSQEIIDFLTVNQIKHDSHCPCCHHHPAADVGAFCESPFRFVLQTTPSSGCNTPELASPATSPTRHKTQDKESNDAERLKKFQSKEEEEDKEQCSPVSVLDPLFDDDETHRNDDDEEVDEDGFDLECSYAIVQRAKQQLLYKLRRFEKLAGLDPVELEKTMLDEEEDEDETLFMEEDDFEDDTSREENDFRELVFDALCRSSVHHEGLQIPAEGLKKLVSDLVAEEERELSNPSEEDREMVVRRVCKRLEMWKEVESNTIDMMIEEDFLREESMWKKNGEMVKDMAGELEIAIFGFLVEEFSEELEC